MREKNRQMNLIFRRDLPTRPIKFTCSALSPSLVLCCNSTPNYIIIIFFVGEGSAFANRTCVHGRTYGASRFRYALFVPGFLAAKCLYCTSKFCAAVVTIAVHRSLDATVQRNFSKWSNPLTFAAHILFKVFRQTIAAVPPQPHHPREHTKELRAFSRATQFKQNEDNNNDDVRVGEGTRLQQYLLSHSCISHQRFSCLIERRSHVPNSHRSVDHPAHSTQNK